MKAKVWPTAGYIHILTMPTLDRAIAVAAAPTTNDHARLEEYRLVRALLLRAAEQQPTSGDPR